MKNKIKYCKQGRNEQSSSQGILMEYLVWEYTVLIKYQHLLDM